MLQLTMTALLAASLAFIGHSAAIDSRQACSGVLVISAHGCGVIGPVEGEPAPYNNGILKALGGGRKQFASFTSDCGSESYGDNVQGGAEDVKGKIAAAVKQCPNKKVVLVGYSQGANVMMNVVGGRPENGLGALEGRYNRNIGAVVVMGDPSRTPKTPGLAGNANKGAVGNILRQDASIQQLFEYDGRIISFCNAGDEFCTEFNTDTHALYFAAGRYVDAGVGFVRDIMS